jgi:hypothetical protein
MNNIAFLYLTTDTPNRSINYLIKNNYNIYIHNKNKIDTKYNNFIINKIIKTDWGKYSLVEATINLLKTAINNNENKYFLLCSGDSYLLRKEIKYEGLSCFDFIRKENKYYKTSQWWILNKKDALTIINTVNKYKYLQKIKFKGAIDEYYFLTVLINENKNYKFNNYHSIYKRWFISTISKSPCIFNKLTNYDIQDIKKIKPIFIRKILPTFTINEYKNRKKLYIILIELYSDNLDFFINNDIDIIIFSAIEINKINEKLKEKCICIFPIIFKFFYDCILDLYINYFDYLKQWTTIYIINQKYNNNKYNNQLYYLPTNNIHNKKIFYKLDDNNYILEINKFLISI